MKMRLPFSRKRLSCRQVGQLVQGYLDGETDEESASKIAAHLDECRRCGMDADTYREIKAALERNAPGDVEASVDRLREFGESLTKDQGADA
jgi:anti-sigma factor RsiW